MNRSYANKCFNMIRFARTAAFFVRMLGILRRASVVINVPIFWTAADSNRLLEEAIQLTPKPEALRRTPPANAAG